MEISRFLQAIWRRKWIALLTPVVTIIMALIITQLTPAQYRTVAVLRILTPGNSDFTQFNTVYSDRLTTTYLRILNSFSVKNELKKRANREILPQIDSRVIPNTELLEISVDERDPALANLFAAMIIEQSQVLYFGDRSTTVEALRSKVRDSEARLETLRTKYRDLFDAVNPNRNEAEILRQELNLEEQSYAQLQGQFQQALLLETIQSRTVTLIEPAVEPERPVYPIPVLNLVIGAIVGILGGFGLSLLFENIDTTLYSIQQVEQVTDIPIVGKIPSIRQRNKDNWDRDSNQLESYRLLRTNLLAQNRGVGIIAITSAEPHEGKSTITAKIASTIARNGLRVIAVDLQFYAPTLHKLLKINNEVGLTEVFHEQATLEQAIQSTAIPNLFALTAGTVKSDTGNMLETLKLQELLNKLSTQYDIVLLDTSAVLAYADTTALATYIDGIVLVVEIKKTKSETLRLSLEQLQQIKTPILGLVLNRL
jgi:non-specific protein-tyrosine kinase